MLDNKKIVAIDIGNVCFKIRENAFINNLKTYDPKTDENEIKEAVHYYALGCLNTRDFLDKCRKALKVFIYDNKIIELFAKEIGDEVEGMNNIIEEFSNKDFRFIYFSDTNPIHINEVSRKLSFAYLITGGIFSFEVGQYKPHSDMFNEFETKYGKPVLYIDDKAENCFSAMNKRQWKSFCFNFSVDELYKTIQTLV